MRAEELRELDIFKGVSDERLEQLLAVGRTIEIEPGLELFTEGDPASHWWVLVDGAVDLFRTVGREEARVGQMVPGRWAGGFQAWDADGVYLATGRGVEFGRLLQVPADDLRALMEEWLPLAVHLVRGVFGTARSIEATVRQRESLITLGTLSAGLAHELNNPAAAAVRTVESMGETLTALLHSLGELAEGAISAEQFLGLDGLRRQIDSTPVIRTPMQVADAEDELGEWLQDHDIDDPWALASTLAAAGVPVSWLERGGRPCSRAPRSSPVSSGSRARCRRVPSSRSCARPPAASPSSSTPSAPTRRWTAPPCSPSSSSRASRARS